MELSIGTFQPSAREGKAESKGEPSNQPYLWIWLCEIAQLEG